MPNCFDIVKQSKTHILWNKDISITHIAMATVVPYGIPTLKKRYALCCTYFIKLCVNLCLLHNLNSGIGVEFQGAHRSLRISVIDSLL